MEDKDWVEFKRRLKAKTSIDLDLYKENQMQRRLHNLRMRNNRSSLVDLFQYVEADKERFRKFIEYLTINVSEFFRTPDKFSELEARVIPDLLSKTPRLNIWSAGCSIGAEPYSLAIILKERTPLTKHRILATDLDVQILARARAGYYMENEIKNIPPNRKDKYFQKRDDKWYVDSDIKSRIEFKRHNLLLDPFESGFHLILCRNVVIYFTEEAKDKLYRRFFAALRPGGVLFVGGTEAILNFRDMGYESYLPFFYRKPVK